MGEQRLSTKVSNLQVQTKSEGFIFGQGAFGQQIWRWIRGRVPFYPLYQNFFVNRKLPIYVDMNNLLLVYQSIPALRSIIDKKGEMIKNARLCVYKLDDYETNGAKAKKYPQHPILKLLKNPNPLQNWGDFITQHSTFYNIYSNSFLYKLGASSASFPKVLWNLPPADMKIMPTGKLFMQTRAEEIIDEYIFFNTGGGQEIHFKPSEILRLTQGASDKYFFGESRILTNKIIISNIDGAYKTRNIILNEKGAIGILSNESKDTSGAIPLGEDERKRIEHSYHQKYGLGEDQMKIIMTNASLKWQAMSYPTKDLMLFEEVEDDFSQLCAAWGVERDVFPSSGINKPQAIGSSGEGKIEEALRLTYQNCIQQEINSFCEMLNADPQFQLESAGYCLRAHFDHVPMMQENELERERIKTEQATAHGNITTQVLALNKAIADRSIEREVAINILVNVFRIEAKIAETLITQQAPPEPEPQVEPTDEVENLAKNLTSNYNTHAIFISKSIAPTIEDAMELYKNYGGVDEVKEKKNSYMFTQMPIKYFMPESMLSKQKAKGIKIKVGIIKPEYQYQNIKI